MGKPTIAIAAGDPAGIGPEVSIKAALDPAVREECLAHLAVALGADGRVRVLLHSIALGNLKLLLPEPRRERPTVAALAAALGVQAADVAAVANRLFGSDPSRIVLFAFTRYPKPQANKSNQQRQPCHSDDCDCHGRNF